MMSTIHKIKINYDDMMMYVEALSNKPYTIFLDSNRPSHPNNIWSILCWSPVTTYTKDKNIGAHAYLDLLKNALQNHQFKVDNNEYPFIGGLMGFFSYDFGCELQNLPHKKQTSETDSACFSLYSNTMLFNHKTKEAVCFTTNPTVIQEIKQSPLADDNTPTQKIDWQYSTNDKKYQSDTVILKEKIYNGDFYQINLTRQLSSPKPTHFNSFNHYKKLRASNTAPFSAFMNCGTYQLLCNSPERFIKSDGINIETKPIKGTLPSSQDKTNLQKDIKERAENTMIVDLMRNDLSQNCKPHSVRVPNLCAIETFENIHHLVSTVTGEISPNTSIFDILKDCLPGGSITGAPKIAAMQAINAIEPEARGPYCGSLGYIGFNNKADFNILIRTLIATPDKLIVNTGGGIVSDSDPEKELQETKDKIHKILESFK